MNVIRLSEAPVRLWSGGTTTELYIYPVESTFAEQNFELRISLATVEKSETTFTPLSGTTRTLLVLEGTQLLEHDGHHTAELGPLEQDTFSGDWTTHCKGISTNFNVMTKRKKSAKIEVQMHTAATTTVFGFSNGLTLVYLLKGQVECAGSTIHPKEALVLEKSTHLSFLEASQLVVVTIPVEL